MSSYDYVTYGNNYSNYLNLDELKNLLTNKVFLGVLVFVLLFGLFVFIGQWKMIKKLGKPGWSLLVPIYNGWVYLELGGLPGWLILVPVANAIGAIVAAVKIPTRFGKGIGCGFANLFFPYIVTPILGYGKAMPVEEKETPTEEKPDLMAENHGEIKADGSIDIMANPSVPVETITPEETKHDNELVEEPALNVTEPIVEETPVEASSIPEENITKEEEPVNIPNAFDMPMPSLNTEVKPEENIIAPEVNNITSPEPVEVVPQNEEVIPTLDTLNIENQSNPLDVPAVDIKEETPTLDTLETIPVIPEEPVIPETPEPLNSIEDDIKEATIELPKMVNAEVNENITATRKCPFCGTENEYSSKTCLTCGNSLN